MTTSAFRESPHYLRGRKGEMAVKRWLQLRGWFVIPSYDYSGEDGNKAPRMEGLRKSLVIPDLDIGRGGIRRWAEVKTKAKANFFFKTGKFEHGIDERHWWDYIEAQQITGAHVWLFIVQEDSQTILFDSLDHLGEGRFGGQYGKGGMRNWPVDRFRHKVEIASIPALGRPLAKGRPAFEEGNTF